MMFIRLESFFFSFYFIQRFVVAFSRIWCVLIRIPKCNRIFFKEYNFLCLYLLWNKLQRFQKIGIAFFFLFCEFVCVFSLCICRISMILIATVCYYVISVYIWLSYFTSCSSVELSIFLGENMWYYLSWGKTTPSTDGSIGAEYICNVPGCMLLLISEADTRNPKNKNNKQCQKKKYFDS